MKKILAIFLALITILSITLVACNEKAVTTPNNDNDDDNDFVIQSKNTTDSSDTGDTNDVPDGDWTPVSYQIYAMTKINLRAEDSKSSTSIGTVEAATALTAVAKSEKWYKISYNNQDAYVSADYVTETVAEATFTTLADADQFEVKVKQHNTQNNENAYQVNLRAYPSFDTDLATTSVTKADTDTNPMTVIAKNGTGSWYKVTYKGSEYYLAITSKTKPYLEGIPATDGNGNGAAG